MGKISKEAWERHNALKKALFPDLETSDASKEEVVVEEVKSENNLTPPTLEEVQAVSTKKTSTEKLAALDEVIDKATLSENHLFPKGSGTKDCSTCNHPNDCLDACIC